MAEKRIQYLAEDINTILDKAIIKLETEADRELLATPLKRAGGLGRTVFVLATKKYYTYNINTDTWVEI